MCVQVLIKYIVTSIFICFILVIINSLFHLNLAKYTQKVFYFHFSMKIPETVKPETLRTYAPSANLEPNRKIKSEYLDWDLNHPKTLVRLCIEKVAENWLGEPKLQQLIPKDRELFLQILDINVPLQILVDNIKSDTFWKRFYLFKWKDSPVLENGKQWINIFMERYYADTLESINPSQYDPEMINNLVKLCGPYIQSLSIRSLIPTDLPVQRMTSPEMADLISNRHYQESIKPQVKFDEALTRDHISLYAVLGSLTNLTELHITFQLKGIGINFRKDQFQFTNNDAKNLARGLEKCLQLKTLRITMSDLNCHRVKTVLRGLSESKNLETLDFSHGKIKDEGIASVAKFISRHGHLRNLILTDNLFGPLGAESLSHALNHYACGLRTLDLRLNNNLGSEGVAYIAVSLARGCNLTSINLSGCGINSGPLKKTPAGVWSATSAENPPSCGDLLARAIGLVKTPLRSLDLSVNDIGCPSDSTLSNAICLSYIVDINLKRSGMSSMSIAIAESAAAAQRLRREAEKGIRFRRSAGRVLQARRVAKCMNIDADPVLLAQKLSARPSIVSVASEEGSFNITTQPLPQDFSFVPIVKSASQSSSITGPSLSRRSSHNMLLELMTITYPINVQYGTSTVWKNIEIGSKKDLTSSSIFRWFFATDSKY